MADVFLSYARPSANDAMRIANCLRSAGYSVWYDESLPAHRAFTDVIAEQLDTASAVLVLWTNEAAGSHWVRSEASRGLETGRLVQLRLDDVRLPMPFDQIQCADLRRWGGDCDLPGWKTVIGSIAALAGEDRPAEIRVTRSAPDRRKLLLAGGAVVILGGSGFAIWRNREPTMSPEAELLLQKGMDALQANDALDPEDEGTTAQAIALLTEATRLAPQSELAWGGLALAYAARRRSAPVEERPGLEARGRSAAEAALRLDPSEPRSLAALRIMAPVYQNWLEAEREARRALSKNSNFPILLFVLSDVLGSVGRWRAATELSNRLDRKKFLLPGAERKAIINLWSAGDLQAADAAIKAAVERWPKQRQVWRTQIAYLLYSGRASEALAILNDVEERPLDVPTGLIEAASATARALTGQMSKQDAVEANLSFLRTNPVPALAVAQACAAIGDVATSFDLLDGYYFGERQWAALAPPAGNQDRQTSPLFQPPMRNLRQDPRFDRLVERIGLTAYWRQSRTVPDYRHNNQRTEGAQA
ncbi:MAG TPA: TIR domain-containing protein [Sphingomicrobium sp.]|nr:TIR domain-containing protein [Sphingomicrobium sp.]